VGPSTLKLVAAMPPPKRTALALVRLVPVIVTLPPGRSAAGMVRMRGVTVRVATLWPVPTSSAMAILAVVARHDHPHHRRGQDVIEVALAAPKAT